MALRNVVTFSHLDPDLYEWLKYEAARRSGSGTKVRVWQVLNDAVRAYKDHEKEVAHAH